MKKNNPQKNIPEGWQKTEVGNIFSFLRTYAISRENLISGTDNTSGIGNIHYGDIHATYKASSIDLENVSVPLVKDKTFLPKKEDFLRDGDLVMADVSEDYEGIGTTVSVHGLENKKVVGGLHTFVLRDTKKKTEERYRQYIFCNPEVRNKLKKIANGVSVYGVSKTNLAKLVLSLPPIEEQKSIVVVLESWDKMINKLAKKIKIKKNIKKGLMQNLLTGKVRLAGFDEKWQTVKLNELGKTYAGIAGKDKDDFGYGKPFITYMNIYSSSEINSGNCGFVKIDNGEKQNKAKYGDIFFTTSSETPDEVCPVLNLLNQLV